MARAQPLTAVLVGAGLRGRHVYGAHALAHPEVWRLVALAEPDPQRRQALADEHGLAPEVAFSDWRALLDAPRRADVAVVATGDALHVEPALAAIERGYHVLLEKPIAPAPGDCARVVDAAARAGGALQVAHVLRYTPFYRAVREVIRSGRLGALVSLELRERVAHWHMAHSFVRGKFRSRREAAPFLLAKSCHDLDLMSWFAGRGALRIASFGALSGFVPERAPAGAPERCTDGCPARDACPHDAERFYLGADDALARAWPWSDVSADPSRAARRRALERGRYGRCVYRCDNDVVDHQVVEVEFEGGLTGSFSVHGHASRESREIRVAGLLGDLHGVLDEGWIEVTAHGSFESERQRFDASPLGHFGGDEGLIQHFADAVRRGETAELAASARVALDGHLLGFAAERARERGEVVDVARFRDAASGGGA